MTLSLEIEKGVGAGSDETGKAFRLILREIQGKLVAGQEFRGGRITSALSEHQEGAARDGYSRAARIYPAAERPASQPVEKAAWRL